MPNTANVQLNMLALNPSFHRMSYVCLLSLLIMCPYSPKHFFKLLQEIFLLLSKFACTAIHNDSQSWQRCVNIICKIP